MSRLSRAVSFKFAAVLAVTLSVAAAQAADPELCDGRDSNANGVVDEGCPRQCPNPRGTGPELLMTDPTARAQLGRDRALVWDGQRFAFVYQELVGSDQRIVFRRADPSGRLLGSPLPISPTLAVEQQPVLDWSGNGYGIAWSEEDFGLPLIKFAFVDATGALVVGPLRVSVPDQDGTRPSIAWDGSAFTIAWSWYNGRIHMRRVTPAGVFVQAEKCINCSGTVNVAEVAIAIGAGRVGYLYSDGLGALRFVQSDLNGTTIAPELTLVTAAGADLPAIAWNGSDWAVAWWDKRGVKENIWFNRLDLTPARILASDLHVNDNESYAAFPSLAWTGQEYAIAWYGGAAGPFSTYFRRISAAGTLVGPSITAPGSNYWRPQISLAWTGARAAVLRDEDTFGQNVPLKLRFFDCCTDDDGDGVSWCDGDGDDGDARVKPGAPEICDGKDNDLDGTIDESCDRACDGAPIVVAGTLGTQASATVGLAVRGDVPHAFIAHADAAQPGVQLALDRGGPSWTLAPLESDAAVSEEPSAAWTGARVATVFRDDRAGAPALRFSARDGNNLPLALDQLVDVPLTGTKTPVLEWSGRRFGLAWVSGAAPAARFSLLTPDGARLLDDPVLVQGATGDAVAAAIASDPRGGSALVYLEPRPGGGLAVMLLLINAEGGRRAAPIELAPPVAGRRDPAIVATETSYLAAWSGPEGAGGAREIMLRAADANGAPLGLVTTLTSARGNPDAPALTDTGAEVVVVFRDARDGGSARGFRARVSPTSARLGPDVSLGADHGIGPPRAAWDGSSVWVAWTRASGVSRDVAAARIDCLAAAQPARVRGLLMPADKVTLRWDVVEAATTYDVVSGNLAKLAAGQGFAVAVDSCEANDLPATQLTLPPRLLPRFYLVRANVSGTAGSYADDGLVDTAARDVSIAGSAGACP